MLLNISLSALVGIPFCIREYLVGKVDIIYVFTGYCGYIALVLVFYSMLYLSICKDYKKISFFFAVGMTVTVFLSFLLVKVFHWGITYGWSKSMLEQILMDIYKADETWNIILLRYFNPIGAHKSGLMGENPNGIPNNLMPYVTQVAVGKLKELGVFGNDYDTPDGTGVRDYIHVVDLAKGHVKALQKIDEKCGFKIYNLGTGKGYSVLDIVKNFEAATGMKVPYVIKDRRPGDIATCYCDPGKAAKELDWKAENGIKEMCEDSWRWQKKNPNGYEG